MLFFSFKGISQNSDASTNNIMGNINASGNNASGSSGTVAYSIGQVFYTYIGLSVYNVAQGIQHEETSQTLDTIEHPIEPKIEISIYPNPTKDYVNINMKGYEFENDRSYQLYDYQGRLLQQHAINDTENQINLSNLSTSIYIIKIYVKKKVVKTLKVVKK